MKSQSRKHLWFSRMVFALSLGSLLLATGCSNPAPSTTSGSSSSGSSSSGSSSSGSSSSTPSTPTAAGTFTPVGNMTTARADQSATLLLNGKVLIAGGTDGFQALASAELYDPATRTFAPTASMISPRYAHSTTLLADGRVLMAGGYGISTPSQLTVEIYDPSTGAFSATGNTTSIGGGVHAINTGAAALLPDGRVFVASADNAEIYDPRSGTFTPTGPYLGQNPGFGNFVTVTLLTNGKVLLTGCADGCGGVGAELFDPGSGTFSVTGPMMSMYLPDYGYTATLLADGRVFFLGSYDPPYFADTEVYDPASGTFASTGSSVSQAFAPASRLTDGTVLVAGGRTVPVADARLPAGVGGTQAQLYVPASGMFTLAGQMTTGRFGHAATPLPDNTVLITGGFASFPDPTSSAELYKPH